MTRRYDNNNTLALYIAKGIDSFRMACAKRPSAASTRPHTTRAVVCSNPGNSLAIDVPNFAPRYPSKNRENNFARPLVPFESRKCRTTIFVRNVRPLVTGNTNGHTVRA